MRDNTIINNLRAIDESCIKRFTDNRTLMIYTNLHLRAIEKVLTSRWLLFKFIFFVIVWPKKAHNLIVNTHIEMIKETEAKAKEIKENGNKD